MYAVGGCIATLTGAAQLVFLIPPSAGNGSICHLYSNHPSLLAQQAAGQYSSVPLPSLWPNHSHHPIPETREEAMGIDRGESCAKVVRNPGVDLCIRLKGPAVEESSRPCSGGLLSQLVWI
jgi:hypothetical protein